MMEIADAAKLNETRGWTIDPENCWHDWQKLRDELGRKPSLPAGPKFNQIQKDDPVYVKTVADARATLPVFRKLLADRPEISGFCSVKTRLMDGESHANMWLTVMRDLGDGFEGQLFETPSYLPSYQKWQTIIVPDSELLDWMANIRGKLHGGFSIRFFRCRKPESERAEYDDYIGIEEYLPLPENP
jgi:uncharacterized protein YegJ (DUF2314 family)